MQVWNVVHAARWKYRTQNVAKKSPSAHHRTTLSGYIFATKACIDNRKNLLNSDPPPCVSTIWWTSAHWQLRSVGAFGAPSKFQPVSRLCFITAPTSLNRGQQNLAWCLDVCCLLDWYTIYTFLGALASWRNFASCKIHFASKSCKVQGHMMQMFPFRLKVKTKSGKTSSDNVVVKQTRTRNCK